MSNLIEYDRHYQFYVKLKDFLSVERQTFELLHDFESLQKLTDIQFRMLKLLHYQSINNNRLKK